MAKTRTVLKMNENGNKFTVVYHEGCNNPYWVYRHTWVKEEDGFGGYYYTESKRIAVKYADMKSAVCHIAMTI